MTIFTSPNAYQQFSQGDSVQVTWLPGMLSSVNWLSICNEKNNCLKLLTGISQTQTSGQVSIPQNACGTDAFLCSAYFRLYASGTYYYGPTIFIAKQYSASLPLAFNKTEGGASFYCPTASCFTSATFSLTRMKFAISWFSIAQFYIQASGVAQVSFNPNFNYQTAKSATIPLLSDLKLLSFGTIIWIGPFPLTIDFDIEGNLEARLSFNLELQMNPNYRTTLPFVASYDYFTGSSLTWYQTNTVADFPSTNMQASKMNFIFCFLIKRKNKLKNLQ